MEAYKNLIKEIEKYISKLETASLTMDELFELEKLTRKLHERSIILRYKAFENKVGIESQPVQETPIEEPKVEVVEEPTPMPEPEPIEEKEEELEFNIFENEEEEEELGFVFEAPQEEDEEEEITVEDQVEPQEIAPEPNTPSSTHSRNDSFIDQFKAPDNSLGSQFAGAKLSTLIGAFGLNEKLMFINELFDGSSEMFSDAIKALDAKKNMEEANAMLDDLAREHSWDPEEDAVGEFIVFIQRRHA